MVCAGCGYEYGTRAWDELPDALRAVGSGYRVALDRPDDALRHRPDPSMWSALEYACHFRDILVLQRERTVLALIEECPTLVPIYRDERVALGMYEHEAPDAVAGDIHRATERYLALLAEMTPEQRARTCIYNYPEPAARDVAWIADHTLHEGAHHLDDIAAGLGRSTP